MICLLRYYLSGSRYVASNSNRKYIFFYYLWVGIYCHKPATLNRYPPRYNNKSFLLLYFGIYLLLDVEDPWWPSCFCSLARFIEFSESHLGKIQMILLRPRWKDPVKLTMFYFFYILKNFFISTTRWRCCHHFNWTILPGQRHLL